MAKDVIEFHCTKLLNTIKEVEDLSLISSRTSCLEAIENYLESQSQKNKAKCSSRDSELQLLGDLDDILAECKIFSRQCKEKKKFICFNPIAKFIFEQKIKRRLSGIQKRVPTVEAEDEHNGLPRISPKCCLTFDEINASTNLRIDSHKKSIEKLLFEGGSDNGLKVIGIVGMCGSGKTAVAKQVCSDLKQVCSDLKESEIFPIWVCLSDILCYEKDSEARILKFILEKMGKDVDMEANNYSTAELLAMLKDLLSGKRYLIVLDDMWHVTDFFVNLNEKLPASRKEHFLRGLPRSCGGIVIITSRLEEVARRIVGDKYLISLQPVMNGDQKDDSCWNIFEQNLDHRLGKDDREALEKIKYDIIYQCHDLPLAAKTLATIFSER